MADTTSHQGLYEDVGSEYFERRQLHKGVGWILLWGLGVGAAIGGHFLGWNSGLLKGGFWGMLIATVLMAMMYVCLVFTVAELSAALPYAGGFYSFARQAFGPFGGFACGVITLIEYLLAPAVIVVAMGNVLNMWLPMVPPYPYPYPYLWWLLFYVMFVAINIRGVKLTLRVGLLVTILSILILLTAYVSALAMGAFDVQLLFNVIPDQGQSATWLPKGWSGIFAALPFALWFYRATSQLPFAAEETHEAAANVPKALIFAIFTLLVLSFLTLVISSGVNGGAADMGAYAVPLLAGLTAIFGEQISALFGQDSPVLALIVLIALMGSLQSTIYAYSRILFALSRAGYLPRWISVTSRYHTPARALILGAVVGLICAFVIKSSGIGDLMVVLFSMVIFAALISYALVFMSYIDLKREEPDLPRPYLSPLGERGAMVGGVLSLIAIVACFSIPEFRSGIYGIFIMLLLSGVYWKGQVVRRSSLVRQAPEEKVALDSHKKEHVIQEFITARLVLTLLLLGTIYGIVRFGVAAFSDTCPPACIGANLMRKDFSGEDFSGISFVEASLRGANFEGANLTNADFSGANLVDAKLGNATLSGAKFIGVDLRNADLGGAIMSGTDMRGANLSFATLTDVDLTQVQLRGIKLNNAELVGAELQDVNMAGVEFVGAQMKGANLTRANLAGSTLSAADLSGAELSNADLTGAWLNKSNLTGANLRDADLSGSSLIGANLASANLQRSNIVGSILIGATFSGADLRAADLRGSRWSENKLLAEDLELDPVLNDMSNTERESTVKDADLSGVNFNSQTRWPSGELATLPDVDDVAQEEEEEEDESAKIKVGILHSLSGPLGLTERSVSDATLLAIDEINAAGGVLGQKLEPMIEDGGSDPDVFYEKSKVLLEKDEVSVVFGCWTSNCRKTVAPIFEKSNGLLFYPASYEGLEQSPNIFYTGAEPTQQIIPAVQYLLNQEIERIFLVGSDTPFSRTDHAIIKALLIGSSATVVGEADILSDESDFNAIMSSIEISQPDILINSLVGESNIAFFEAFNETSFTASTLPVMSLRVTEEEVHAIGGENVVGHLTIANYYETIDTVENPFFVEAYQKAYGQERVTSDAIHAGYFGVFLWKEMVEKAGDTSVDAVRAAAASSEIEFQAPGGLVRIDGESQHTYLYLRIGQIREDGLIEEIFSSDGPIKPNPSLEGYDWRDQLLKSVQE